MNRRPEIALLNIRLANLCKSILLANDYEIERDFAGEDVGVDFVIRTPDGEAKL